MSAGFLCNCPRPPLDGLTMSDGGHRRRPYAPDQRDCPEYAEDQVNGGMCRFCREAHDIRRAATSEAKR